jgi:hypothetical protein
MIHAASSRAIACVSARHCLPFAQVSSAVFILCLFIFHASFAYYNTKVSGCHQLQPEFSIDVTRHMHDRAADCRRVRNAGCCSMLSHATQITHAWIEADHRAAVSDRLFNRFSLLHACVAASMLGNCFLTAFLFCRWTKRPPNCKLLLPPHIRNRQALQALDEGV